MSDIRAAIGERASHGESETGLPLLLIPGARRRPAGLPHLADLGRHRRRQGTQASASRRRELRLLSALRNYETGSDNAPGC